MKTKLFAAALAALMLGASLPAAALENGRDGAYRDNGAANARRAENFRYGRQQITIRNNGRTFSVDRGDRLFYRLQARPFNFEPGLTYAYTDRCNRYGCVAFVFDDFHRRPIDRVFAPHLQLRGYGWRQARGFDNDFRGYGRYDRDDRSWNNDDDRDFRAQRDGRGDDRANDRNNGRTPERGGVRQRGELEGGPMRR